MGAVDAVDDGVLKGQDVVVADIRLVMRVLQPQPGEFARIKLEQGRGAQWIAPEIVQRAARQKRAGIVAAYPGKPQPRAPARSELVDALRIPSETVLIDRNAVELTRLVSEEHFGGGSEVAHLEIAARRPFVG